MQKIQQFYFNDIAEARQASSPYSVNYLTNRDAERDYFSPLSVATSFFVGDEYISATIWTMSATASTPPARPAFIPRP